MLFSDIIATLGIDEYPTLLEEIYAKGESISDFSEKTVYMLDEEYLVIGDCKDKIISSYENAKKSEALWEYTKAAAAFLPRVSVDDGAKLILPTVDDEYYSYLLLIMALPNAIKNYYTRGFSKSEIIDIFKNFKDAINAGTQKYNWLRHYTSSVIFKTSLFVITPRIITAPVMLLKNKNGEYKLLMINEKIHRDGKILGSAGCENEDGSFISDFSETDEFYIGHEVIDARVSQETSRLRKSEWQLVTKQGDGMAGVHIPRGADLTEEKMLKSFKEAFKITAERYTDFNPKTVHCLTWMLDPKLAEILGPNSKITGFINQYLKYPIKSNGQELFNFVFPGDFDSYESLPEDTSLQRKLKAMYINGEFIHAHAGFVVGSDEWKNT